MLSSCKNDVVEQFDYDAIASWMMIELELNIMIRSNLRPLSWGFLELGLEHNVRLYTWTSMNIKCATPSLWPSVRSVKL